MPGNILCCYGIRNEPGDDGGNKNKNKNKVQLDLSDVDALLPQGCAGSDDISKKRTD